MSSLSSAPSASGLVARFALLLALVTAAVAAPSAMAAGTKAEASVLRLPHCSWDRPGQDPYMGDLVAAVDDYTDMPADVRTRLKERMARRDYDDIAMIRRDAIEGQNVYEPTIREMHFGTHQVCASVSRSAWAPEHQERGLVYCEGEQCVIVPTVCRNLSRVTRRPLQAIAIAPAAGPAEPDGELVFAPPAAGLPDVADALPAGVGPYNAGPLTLADGGGGAWVPLLPIGFGGIPGGLGGGPTGVVPRGPIPAVPEPANALCMAIGLVFLGLLGARRTRASKHRARCF